MERGGGGGGGSVAVRFALPAGCAGEAECPEEMRLAYVTCEQHHNSGIQAEWLSEAECMKLTSLTKRDVFVLKEFKGQLFEKLRTTKCLIVGARCLSCCLTEGTPIPSGSEPVFSVAMRGLKVASSGFSKRKKEEIKQKVLWMGGIYTNELTEDTTHLLCDKVLSDKYCIASEKGISIMSISWIDAVWEASLEMNINGSSPQFSGHKLPIFEKLNVTCSGIARREKEKITKLMNEHGGICKGTFTSDDTDLVILNREGLGSDKYKAAMEYGKSCVLPSWVYASVERGCAQRLQLFKVSGASTSSPVAGNRLPDMSLNFSRITNLKPPSNFIDETQSTDTTIASGRVKMSQESKRSNELNSIEKDIIMAIENFDMSQVKKAGLLFDGFCIYICGVEGTTRERISGCVSRNGGMRYDEPHERVTHVVAGTLAATAQARTALPDVPVLSPLWLLHSITAQKVLDESEYLMGMTSTKNTYSSTTMPTKKAPSVEPSSPMSKRNLALLRHASQTPRPPVPKFDLEQAPPEDDIVQQYLAAGEKDTSMADSKVSKESKPTSYEATTSAKRSSADKNDETDLTDELTEEIEQIFSGIRFEMQCVDEASMLEISAEVERAGGQVVSEGSGGEYVIVPLDFDENDATNKDARIVTVFWLKDCLSQQKLLELEYYHRPVVTPDAEEGGGVLAGVVLSISTYTGVERLFLDELAQLLGATTQFRFCRRTTSTTRASTHLLCPEAKGDKYAGALKWGLPAVSAQWLLDCAAAARRVKEHDYLIGDTKAPIWTDPIEETIEPPPTGDKENEADMAPPPEGVVAPKRPSTSSKEGTPLKKIQSAISGEGDMSPASRYIAMMRQGLLGTDSQETPKRVFELKNQSINQADMSMKTPPLEDALATPNLKCFSPTTRRRLQAIKRGDMPSDPIRTPDNPFEREVKTPESGFGAALRPNTGRMSPESRKQLWTVVQDIPSLKPQPQSRKDTPLSEVCNQFLSRYNPHGHAPPPRRLDIDDQAETPPSKVAKIAADQRAGDRPAPMPNSVIDDQLQQLSTMVAVGCSPAHTSRIRRTTHTATPATAHLLHLDHMDAAVSLNPGGPESQTNTVGWDDSSDLRHINSNIMENPVRVPTPPPPPPKKFMLSSHIDNREEICAMITSLGGTVSHSSELDPEVTHLLLAALGRSEKVLGTVAGGRWMLHPVYVARSHISGRFLQEEEFEWGNEKAASVLPSLKDSDLTLARAAHRWRVTRAAGKPGPFHGMRAVLHVQGAKQKMLARLIASGDGECLDVTAPYKCSDATHCFVDMKRYPLERRDILFFVSHNIPVCPTIVLSNYLIDETTPCAATNCIPEYKALLK